MTLRILIMQSDPRSAQPLVRYFEERGDKTWQVAQIEAVGGLLVRVHPDLLFLDIHFPGNEWLAFLRQTRQQFPNIKIIITNKFPDLQREMLAREQGVQVFLRQPYTAAWIEGALEKVGVLEPAQKPHSARAAPARYSLPGVGMPIRFKITLPYLVLALLFTLASAYVVSQVVLESVQERFLNQLVSTGKQGSDWMVREENRLLTSLRLISNSQGMGEAIAAQDAETLRALVLPLMVNTGEEAVEILDMQGGNVLSLRKPFGKESETYLASSGNEEIRQWEMAQNVLEGKADRRGDKFAGLGIAPWGSYIYVGGPVFDQYGNRSGVILLGKSTATASAQIRQQVLADATLYSLQGEPLATSLTLDLDQLALDAPQVNQVLQRQADASFTRALRVGSVGYVEILGAWEMRGGDDVGVIGIAMPQAFLVRTSRWTQLQIFLLAALGILLVVVVGVFLSNIITQPLLRLVGVSTEVARGNLEVKVDVKGNDEIAVLARSFNAMISGLQEGSIYRDLLGRTVSPAVREQLRQTFSSGSLRLEGQEAVATVLMSDIRGFTSLSEKIEPATVFQWLNEYFELLVPIVSERGGVVNKFDGDAMLAFFGILPQPASPTQSALAACQTAIEMQRAIDLLNEQRIQRGDQPIITGIGINTGSVIAGGLGSSDRLHYTIIGDTVNTTQRIEGLTREVFTGSGILISHATYLALGEHRADFRLELLGERVVHGKSEPILIYNLRQKEAIDDTIIVNHET